LRHCIVPTKVLPNKSSAEPPSKRPMLWVHRKHLGTTRLAPSHLKLIGELKACSPTQRHNPVSISIHPWKTAASFKGELMRVKLTGLILAGALCLVCYQSADAVPANAAAMKRAAIAASTVQNAQFYARPTRHGVIECYRQFIVGRPVCRHFYRWWW